MHFGIQYYPEHWPEERWLKDAQLMREAGVNTVRMGEFAWSSYEPEKGKFDFSWMERAIGVFGSQGIRTLLCTCSRTPPLWLYRECPEIKAVERDGRPKATDHRYHVGLAHPVFMEVSQRIDEQVIRHFSGNPNILGWQVDNEVGYNDCFCEQCLVAFRKYLAGKYGSMDKLREAWGPHFWSYAPQRFSEIPLPQSNPQALLEYRRFLSGVNIAFCRWRADRMRELDPGKPVTTNFQNLFLSHTDYHRMGECLDFNGMNNYPKRTPHLAVDYYRGQRGSVWILEQQTHLANADSPAGLMRLNGWRAIAKGADALLFFRWRQCRWGQEQFGDGVLPHSGEPGRLYREFSSIGREVQSLAARLDATRPVSQAAIVYGYQSRWAVDAAGFAGALDPVKEAIRFHDLLERRVTSIDAMDPGGDLGRYKLVIAPRLWMTDAALGASLEAFVREGGVLCLTACSGVADTEGKSHPFQRPGHLREMVGIVAENFYCDEDVACGLQGEEIASGPFGRATLVFDEIVPQEARVIATYADGGRQGQPAITLNRYGRGQVIYLGTILDASGMESLVDYLCAISGIGHGMDIPADVSAYERVGDDERILFLLNNSNTAVHIGTGEGWKDAFTGDNAPSVSLDGHGVAILSQPPLFL